MEGGKGGGREMVMVEGGYGEVDMAVYTDLGMQ